MIKSSKASGPSCFTFSLLAFVHGDSVRIAAPPDRLRTNPWTKVMNHGNSHAEIAPSKE